MQRTRRIAQSRLNSELILPAIAAGILSAGLSGAAFAQEEPTEAAPAAEAAAAASEPATAATSSTESSDSDLYFFGDDSDLSAIDALLEEPTWDGPRFGIDGYYRARWNVIGNPGAESDRVQVGPDRLDFIQHRLRLQPRIELNDKTRIVADAIVGEGVRRCDPSNAIQPYHPGPCNGFWGANGLTVLDKQAVDTFFNFKVVSFWGEVTTPVGVVRVGRQPSHWGLGIFSNDGLHDQDFGDNHFGDNYDRFVFATKPMGEDSDLITALIYDRMSAGTPQLGIPGMAQIQDPSKTIHEGILVLLYKTAPLDLGVYQVLRTQNNPFSRIIATDVYGRLDIGLLYGAFESVWVYGKSRSLPFLDQEDLSYRLGDKVKVGQWGWAFEGGLRFDWYDFKLKMGNAQGDQNLTNDRPRPKVKSITLHPDYNIGLVMFDYAYANLVERRIAQNFDRLGVLVDDGVLTQAQVDELQIAADLARTNGGVSNAFYVNPIAVLNPTEDLTVKAGLLWARSNAGIAVLGEGANAVYHHNLGWEFDGGFEYRFRQRFAVGAEGGLLLPGDAFDQPETRLDVESGLNVPVAGTLYSADPVWLSQLRFTFYIQP
ncbi:MAG: hypothetical protein D6761_03815 [Candidatus Dadabacteria bacterium]|nr:MAG: hypothetical protein D6761_03815 [Candidatus Dadabacteria bacterium]